MIKTIIFDLDGTLVQTEALKAMSYARAAKALCPRGLSEEEVVEAFKEVVGLPRSEVAQTLMARFDLEKQARKKMETFHVAAPWQAFVQVRLGIYESLISDPKILPSYLCSHSVGLLKWARRHGYHTGLATMSHCPQAGRVLQILNLDSDFDFIRTWEPWPSGPGQR